MPRVNCVGIAIPPKYPQEEVFKKLGYRKLFWPLFKSTGIAAKPLCVPVEKLLESTAQDMHDNYFKFSLSLSEASIADCLHKANLRPEEIDCLIYVSCTGMVCPTPTYWLVDKMGFRKDAKHIPIVGTGCQGALPAMEVAHNYCKVNPKSKVLVVSCEISNAAYFPDNRTDTNLAMANAIFGDGSTTMLVTGVGPGLEMIDFETIVENEYINDIKLPWESARLKIVLSGKIPYVTSQMAKQVAETLLSRNNLNKEDVAHYIVHSGGSRILDQVEKLLGLPQRSMKYSWDTWEEVGNLSSVTICIALDKLLESKKLRAGDKVIVVSLGAGLQCIGCLTEWRE